MKLLHPDVGLEIAPVLAAGCCVIMKPSELTPLTALMLCDLAKEAGIPLGVSNCISGLGSTTGEAIARHMDIDNVSCASLQCFHVLHNPASPML